MKMNVDCTVACNDLYIYSLCNSEVNKYISDGKDCE